MPTNTTATTTSTPTPPKRDDPAQPVVTKGDATETEALSEVTKAQVIYYERNHKQRSPESITRRTDSVDTAGLSEVTLAQIAKEQRDDAQRRGGFNGGSGDAA